MYVCVFQETGEELDYRSRSLAGEPTWIRSHIEVFKHAANLTSHDWIQLVQSAGDYLFANIMQPKQEKALFALLDACNDCLRMSSPCDMGPEDGGEQTRALKLKVTRALCLCEAILPKTEMAVMFHVLLHVPDAMYRWNGVRNFWAFFGER